jgi:hypothetical protein
MGLPIPPGLALCDGRTLTELANATAWKRIFASRLWRPRLQAYEDGRQARAGIGQYLCFFNEERLHQSLKYLTPKAVYDAGSLQAALQKRERQKQGGDMLTKKD